VTVTAPPRPPRPSDPVDREELEALVEALIEEARQRARRRRQMYAAVVAVVALVGVVVFTVFERTAQSQSASPALAAHSGLAAGAASSKIAFIREPLNSGYAGVLYVMNPDGSGQRRLAPAHPDMSWSPDGQKIAFVGALGRDGFYVMNADGSGQKRLTSLLLGRCDGLARWDGGPAWSPDGRAIAFTRRFCDLRYTAIYVMNADGSEQRRLTRNRAPRPIPNAGPDPVPSPDQLAWSPDGTKIAFISERDGNWELFVMNADGSEQRRLTRNTVRDSNPVWSPDGRRIAFESNWQVSVMNADGSGQRRLTRNGGRNFAPAWSPDGQRIAFERRLGKGRQSGRCYACREALTYEVHVMNADGSEQRRLTPRGAKPGWSPDGRTIAFVSKRGGNNEIYVMNADGSRQRNLTRTRGWQESWLAWSPAQK
jgi:Tol biopolymer transport system component